MLSIVCKHNYISSVDFFVWAKKCYFLAAVTPNLSFSSTKSSQPNMKSKNLAAEIVIAYFIYIFVALLKLLSWKWLFTSWEKSSGKVFYVSLKHKCWNLVKITQISFVYLKLIFILWHDACLKFDSYCIYIKLSLSICGRVNVFKINFYGK